MNKKKEAKNSNSPPTVAKLFLYRSLSGLQQTIILKQQRIQGLFRYKTDYYLLVLSNQTCYMIYIKINDEGPMLSLKKLPIEEINSIDVIHSSLLIQYDIKFCEQVVEICGFEENTQFFTIYIGPEIPKSTNECLQNPTIIAGIFSIQSYPQAEFPKTFQEALKSTLYIQLEILPTAGSGNKSIIIPTKENENIDSVAIEPILC